MLPCQKRQTVIKNGETSFRCLNKECAVSGHTVNEEICSLCDKRVVAAGLPPCRDKKPPEKKKYFFTPASFDVRPEDTPDGNGAKEYPPLSLQLVTYKEALVKWNNAGRPKRSDEEVEHIVTNFCHKCDWYDAEQKRCRGCGCRVTEGGLAILNKVRMATEHCPKELW